MNFKIPALAIVPVAALGMTLAACSSSTAPAASHQHVGNVSILAQPHRAVPRPPVVVIHHVAKPKAVTSAPAPVPVPPAGNTAPAPQHAPAPPSETKTSGGPAGGGSQNPCNGPDASQLGVCTGNGTNSCVAMHDCAPLLPGQKPAPGQTP
jgi:hypothetical protein